jgi:hypothetical protein
VAGKIFNCFQAIGLLTQLYHSVFGTLFDRGLPDPERNKGLPSTVELVV